MRGFDRRQLVGYLGTVPLKGVLDDHLTHALGDTRCTSKLLLRGLHHHHLRLLCLPSQRVEFAELALPSLAPGMKQLQCRKHLEQVSSSVFSVIKQVL